MYGNHNSVLMRPSHWTRYVDIKVIMYANNTNSALNAPEVLVQIHGYSTKPRTHYEQNYLALIWGGSGRS